MSGARPAALVIGAGVSGLTVAIRLLEEGWKVRIIARQQGDPLVSAVAAAIWFPYQVAHPDADRWGLETLDRLAHLAHRPEEIVRPVLARDLRRSPAPPPAWAPSLPHFAPLARDELPAGITAGYRYELLLVETPRYNRWLYEEVARLGGEVTAGEVQSLDEVIDRGQVVINCTGLGARTLVPDPALYAIRGQIALLPAGLVDEVTLDDHDEARPIYVIPRRDGTVVGGTAEVRDEEQGVRPAQAREMLARAARLVPALEGIEPLESRVGLRPARSSVRLELEWRDGGAVVHNYGHGGAGFTLSWGCANEVLRLATQAAVR